MIRLLVLRAVPLTLRPIVILLEGALVASDKILILALPLAMMALMISSIPVHLDYFKSNVSNSNYTRLEENYISGLIWLSSFSLIVLVPVLALLPLELNAILIVGICFLFLIEKIADEISRSLEFRKNFVGWFFIQILRSAWLLIPIALYLFGVPYDLAFMVVASATCLLIFILFLRILRLSPRVSMNGLVQIQINTIFFFGSFLPASYQQLPRIVVAKLYPEEASIFLAVSQFAQSIGLLFNVRFQIPYRKIIARRPIIFQQRLSVVTRKILIPSGLVAALSLIVPMFINESEISDINLFITLFPVLIANSLVFAILSANLGYLQWFGKKSKVVVYYLSCYLLVIIFMVPLVFLFSKEVTIFAIPSVAILIGLFWIFLCEWWFFKKIL